MGKIAVTVILGTLALALAGPAAAAPASAPVCDGAVALRVNHTGLTFIAAQVKGLVPTSIAIPAVSKQKLVDWPLTGADANLDVPATSASIKMRDLFIFMDDGALAIQGRADVTTGGNFTVDNPYVGLGRASCNASVAIKDLQLTVGLKLDDSSGAIKVKVTRAWIDLDNDDSTIAIQGCTLGKVLAAVVNFLRKHFMGTIQSAVEKIAKKKIPQLVEDKLSETIQVSRQVQGFVITGRLDGAATDSHGVRVNLGAGVTTAENAPAACVAGFAAQPAPPCVSAHARVSPRANAMFGAAISEGLVNQALHAAWKSGRLCIDSRAIDNPALTAGVAQLAGMIGQPEGTDFAFTARMQAPPRVRLSIKGGVELQITGLALRLTMQPPGGPLNEVGVRASLSVSAVPWVDPSGNMLALDLRRVTVRELSLQGKDGAPSPIALDPARLTRFITTVAMPLVREKLTGTPLSPAVIDAMSYQVELRELSVSGGYLAAYVNAHKLARVGDKVAPRTQLLNPPPTVVGPKVLQLKVRGSDNRTPASLLRFRARVNGGAWTEPSYGSLVQVAIGNGPHVVEVAAVDHEDNADPTPQVLKLLVDGTVPRLSITRRPDSLVNGGAVDVAFEGRDDRTPPAQLTYTAELYRVPDGGGAAALVQTTEVPADVAQVSYQGLGDGVYKVRVIVADGVGNVTSEDVGFVMSHESGCAVARGAGSPGLALAGLALLALALLARRRHG